MSSRPIRSRKCQEEPLLLRQMGGQIRIVAVPLDLGREEGQDFVAQHLGMGFQDLAGLVP